MFGNSSTLQLFSPPYFQIPTNPVNCLWKVLLQTNVPASSTNWWKLSTPQNWFTVIGRVFVPPTIGCEFESLRKGIFCKSYERSRKEQSGIQEYTGSFMNTTIQFKLSLSKHRFLGENLDHIDWILKSKFIPKTWRNFSVLFESFLRHPWKTIILVFINGWATKGNTVKSSQKNSSRGTSLIGANFSLDVPNLKI